ncbi:MAG: hypothetical protein ACYCPM_10965 [Acidobacteriaceae bacterium]
MEPRLEYVKASPEAAKAMIHLESVVRRSGIDPHLLELIRIRASPGAPGLDSETWDPTNRYHPLDSSLRSE